MQNNNNHTKQTRGY